MSQAAPAPTPPEAEVVPNETSAPLARPPSTRARFASVLRPILRPGEIAKQENPDAVTIGGAAITVGLVGLGVYMLYEFFAATPAPPAIATRPAARPVPSPTPLIPIPMPTAPKVRLGVGIADGRAHFTSFDTGNTRVIVSASGRSVTIVSTVVPVEIDLHITDQAQPVTEVQLNDTTEVLGDAESGHTFSFEVADHSVSMDDPSIQFTVHHQVDQAYVSDDLLQIFVLHP